MYSIRNLILSQRTVINIIQCATEERLYHPGFWRVSNQSKQRKPAQRWEEHANSTQREPKPGYEPRTFWLRADSSLLDQSSALQVLHEGDKRKPSGANESPQKNLTNAVKVRLWN